MKHQKERQYWEWLKTYLLSIRTRDKLGFGKTYLSSMRDNTGNR